MKAKKGQMGPEDMVRVFIMIAIVIVAFLIILALIVNKDKLLGLIKNIFRLG